MTLLELIRVIGTQQKLVINEFISPTLDLKNLYEGFLVSIPLELFDRIVIDVKSSHNEYNTIVILID